MNVIDGLGVAADEGVPANDGDVLQHPGSVAEVADAGALVVGPAHGDFNDAVAALESDEKDLRIEAPALDGLELEDSLRGGARKGLEAALGVGEGQTHDRMGDHVEAAAEELAVERLADGLARAFEPARANGDVGSAGDGGKKAVGFFDGGGEICVGKHDHFAEGVENAIAHAVALSTIARILEHAELGGVGGEGLDDLGSLVAGAVVDDDDLGGPAPLADACEDGLKRATNASFLVEGRDHDAVFRIGHEGFGGTKNTVPYAVLNTRDQTHNLDSGRRDLRLPMGDESVGKAKAAEEARLANLLMRKG